MLLPHACVFSRTRAPEGPCAPAGLSSEGSGMLGADAALADVFGKTEDEVTI